MAQAAVTTKPAGTTAAKLPVWKWSGKTKKGEPRTGAMEAPDADSVKARLVQMGIEPARVRRSGLGDLELKSILTNQPVAARAPAPAAR